MKSTKVMRLYLMVVRKMMILKRPFVLWRLCCAFWPWQLLLGQSTSHANCCKFVLHVCLSVYLFDRFSSMSVCLSGFFCLSISGIQSVCLYLCHLPISLSICQSVCPSVLWLFLFLSACLSVSLHAYVLTCLPV